MNFQAAAREAGSQSSTVPSGQNVLNPDELRKIDAYWRAASYLSVGQLYLYANPLLREPLRTKSRRRPSPASRAMCPQRSHVSPSCRAGNRAKRHPRA